MENVIVDGIFPKYFKVVLTHWNDTDVVFIVPQNFAKSFYIFAA